jgi:hypothetical protein
MEFNSDKPTRSGMYLVDRGMQGKAYRYYNADTDFWGMCGYDMSDADANKDKPSAVGFFPWVGPLTGPNYNKKAEEVESKPAKRKMAKMRGVAPAVTKAPVAPKVKAPKAPRAKSTAVHPDGTVFYREDRQKWVAMYAGKQEAARPTADACLKFLKKKYDIVGVVIEK